MDYSSVLDAEIPTEKRSMNCIKKIIRLNNGLKCLNCGEFRDPAAYRDSKTGSASGGVYERSDAFCCATCGTVYYLDHRQEKDEILTMIEELAQGLSAESIDQKLAWLIRDKLLTLFYGKESPEE